MFEPLLVGCVANDAVRASKQLSADPNDSCPTWPVFGDRLWGNEHSLGMGGMAAEDVTVEIHGFSEPHSTPTSRAAGLEQSRASSGTSGLMRRSDQR